MFSNYLAKTREGEEGVAKKIDVKDLTEEQIEALKRLIRLFRKQPRSEKPARKEEEFTLAAWDSDVIGKLTREELYKDR